MAFNINTDDRASSKIKVGRKIKSRAMQHNEAEAAMFPDPTRDKLVARARALGNKVMDTVSGSGKKRKKPVKR